MVTSEGNDLHLSDGRWKPDNLFAEATDDNVDVEAFLRAQGWDNYLMIGIPNYGSLYLQAWERPRKGGHPEYCSKSVTRSTDPRICELMIFPP